MDADEYVTDTDRLLADVLAELKAVHAELAELRSFATRTETALEGFRQKMSGGILGKFMTG